MVMMIFVYRDALGLTQSFDNKVIVRKSKILGYYPISIKENYIKSICKEAQQIPRTILNKWFNGKVLYEATCDLFRVKTSDEMIKQITKLREKNLPNYQENRF